MSWRRVAVMIMAVLGAGALAICVAACSGSDAAAPNEGAVSATTTPVPDDEPTTSPTTATPAETAVAAVADSDLIAAVRAAFAAERGEMYQAWDDLEAGVLDSMVELRMCAWNGHDVYDSVITVAYETSVADDGSITTRYLSSNNLDDECLNSELVATALAVAEEYDAYWTGVLEDPTSFDAAATATRIFTPGNLEGAAELVAGWVEGGVRWQGTSLHGDIIGTATQPLLWRRYESRDTNIFAILTCRRIDPSYGLYRDEFLLDDFTAGLSEVGPDAIVEYLLTRADGDWRVEGVTTLSWTDCAGPDVWLDAVNDLKPDPVPWQELPRL